ncbi:MAG: hypothetical protein ACKOXB_03800 [Flavobacteriales bacterium]
MYLFDLSYGGGSGNGEVTAKTAYINRMGAGYTFVGKKMSFGLQYHFLFGEYSGEDIFAAFRTSEGLFIADDGGLSDVSVFYRGNALYAHVGKPFRIKENNVLTVNCGAGFLQNNLLARSLGGNLPFLSDENMKGYDQFSFGPSLKQEIRWTYLGPERRINFYVGLFAEEAFLKNLRNYNYFNNTVDAARHFTFLYGIQAGWVIPLYTDNDTD